MKPPASWYRAEAVRLAARLADVEADARAYRELAQQALHQLHALTVARERDQQKYLALLDELRQLRGDERRAA